MLPDRVSNPGPLTYESGQHIAKAGKEENEVRKYFIQDKKGMGKVAWQCAASASSN